MLVYISERDTPMAKSHVLAHCSFKEYVPAFSQVQASRTRLVIDELAAAIGEDGWATGEACAVLLAAAGRGSHDARRCFICETDSGLLFVRFAHGGWVHQTLAKIGPRASRNAPNPVLSTVRSSRRRSPPRYCHYVPEVDSDRAPQRPVLILKCCIALPRK